MATLPPARKGRRASRQTLVPLIRASPAYSAVAGVLHSAGNPTITLNGIAATRVWHRHSTLNSGCSRLGDSDDQDPVCPATRLGRRRRRCRCHLRTPVDPPATRCAGPSKRGRVSGRTGVRFNERAGTQSGKGIDLETTTDNGARPGRARYGRSRPSSRRPCERGSKVAGTLSTFSAIRSRAAPARSRRRAARGTARGR